MSNFRLIDDLPCHDLYTEFNQLLHKKIISWPIIKGQPNRSQICINGVKGHEHDIHYGRGSLIYDWDNFYYDDQGNLKAPERETPLREEDFTELCNPFENTLFEDVFYALREKYNVGRVRIMNSRPKTCLTWHNDDTQRIHYPIKTQEGCFMVVQDEVKHLQQNKWYFVDTLVPHTAFNGSTEERMHLVVNLL